MHLHSHRRNLIETLLGVRGDFITLSRLAEILQTDRKTIKDRTRWLVDRGAIETTKKYRLPGPAAKHGPNAWEVIYSINRRKLMMLLRKPARKSYSGWDAMWRVIRAYKKFNRKDLCELAGVSQSNARAFTKALRKAGYIREARGIWEITIDPGPARPIPPA